MKEFQDSLYAYLSAPKNFYTFSAAHWTTLIFCLFVIILLPQFAKKNLNEKQQHQLGSFLGILISGTFIISQLLILATGRYDINKDLPLQLCNFTNLTIGLVMIRRKFLWFEIFYFWAFAAMLQASFTPELQQGFPHWLFFRYWLGHPGVILCMVYAVQVYKFVPTKKSILKSILVLNIYMVFIAIVNLILNTNYLWICKKPIFPTIIDFCGPWPWYILVLEFIALIHFFVAYLPFIKANRQKME